LCNIPKHTNSPWMQYN